MKRAERLIWLLLILFVWVPTAGCVQDNLKLEPDRRGILVLENERGETATLRFEVWYRD